MVKRDLMADYTFNQKGAITTLLVIAICSLTLLWINLVTPSGTNTMEITFLGSLTAMFWILVPLCLKRIRWSWAAGIIVYLGLFIGAGIEAKDRVLFFSWSAYNVSILLLYVIALVGMYFSFRSIRELPQKPWKNIILGVSGIVIITLVIGATLWSNSISIERFMAQSTIGNIDKELQKMDTLEEKIQHLVAKGNIPSLVAGIVVDDSLVWNEQAF